MTAVESQGAIFERLPDETFWRGEFPRLSIKKSARPLPAAMHAAADLDRAADRVRVEGYALARDDGLIPVAPLLAEAVQHCVDLGLPPTFIYVFDETWDCFHRQHHLLSRLIGEKYRILPNFWAWHIDPKTEQSGWSAHRDKGRVALNPDGTPRSLTMWIPLTEANPLNGCMYIVPANRDRVYNTPRESIIQVDFASVRAAPAKPGEFLFWNQATLHWGGRSSVFATHPRMSMSLEFQRGDIPPFKPGLLDQFCDLDFRERLRLIATQIVQYKHMYRLEPALDAAAQKLLRG